MKKILFLMGLGALMAASPPAFAVENTLPEMDKVVYEEQQLHHDANNSTFAIVAVGHQSDLAFGQVSGQETVFRSDHSVGNGDTFGVTESVTLVYMNFGEGEMATMAGHQRRSCTSNTYVNKKVTGPVNTEVAVSAAALSQYFGHMAEVTSYRSVGSELRG